MGQIAVHVTPRSSKQKLAWKLGQLTIWVHAPAVNNQANESVQALMAEMLGIPPSRVSVVRGATSREKVIDIDGLTTQEIGERLNSCIDSK